MASHRRNNSIANASIKLSCSRSSCFFCTMNEPDQSLRRSKLSQYFDELPVRDDEECVLVLSGLWNIAMTNPDDPEFPSLGIFECLSRLIRKGITDKKWLLQNQNIYIPYYAAHIIGSYTMRKPRFAEKAVNSGVILPLLELMKGKISWVEQRVAVRALGHLASHETTFNAVADHEVEIAEVGMDIARNCLETVYKKFIGVKDTERVKYHSDLLTRGLGGLDLENRKAEEWATQLRIWSLNLLDRFASKEKSLNTICKSQFLKDLCGMSGGLVCASSPGGIGLLRTLCNSMSGKESIVSSKQVVESLCNIARSSDDWQFMAIDCLLLLLKDKHTRYTVIDMAAPFLVDLVELRRLKGSAKLGDAIAQVLLQDYHKLKYGNLHLNNKNAQKALEETWYLKVERRKREKLMSEQELKERKTLAGTLKQEGNQKFWSGQIEKAVTNYSQALELCPLTMRKGRIVLYSNRAQCHLLLGNPEATISDSTRALALSSHSRPHTKSLWRRAQAYDMKGLAKECLTDCLMFVNNYATGRMKSKPSKHIKIPYYAVRMINKQMNATWPFEAAAKSYTDSRSKQKGKKIKSWRREYKESKSQISLRLINS